MKNIQYIQRLFSHIFLKWHYYKPQSIQPVEKFKISRVSAGLKCSYFWVICILLVDINLMMMMMLVMHFHFNTIYVMCSSYSYNSGVISPKFGNGTPFNFSKLLSNLRQFQSRHKYFAWLLFILCWFDKSLCS